MKIVLKVCISLIFFVLLGLTFLTLKPNVGNIIYSDSKSEFKRNVSTVIKEVQKQCYRSIKNEEKLIARYIFSDGISSSELNKDIDFEIDGNIYVNSDCRIKMDITDGIYVATKNYADDKIFVENETNKHLMENLELYYFGDSLIEGYLNDYNGVAHYMEELYDTYTVKDYSVSGSFLTAPNGVGSINAQFSVLMSRLENIPMYSNNIVIVFNGGTNDFMYKNVRSVSFDAEGSEEMDFYLSLKKYINSLKEIQEIKKVNAPIVYLLPRLRIDSNDYNEWIKKTKRCLDSLQVENLIVIDSNEVLEDSD